MRININGVSRDMTPEEVAEFERLQAETPESDRLSPEERIAQLEEQLKATKILLGVG